MLRIFITIKNQSPWPGFNPRNFGPMVKHTNHYFTEENFICLLDWHSKSVFQNIRQILSFSLADVSSILSFQLLCHSLETRNVSQGKEHSRDFAPVEALHIRPLKTRQCVLHYSPRLSFSLKCINFVYSFIPLSSVITLEQMIKRISERCRSSNMNCSFPVIFTICLVAMVEEYGTWSQVQKFL
jgi:hypothetical protein